MSIIHVEKWPSLLLLARHGESEANVRKNAAKAAGQEPSWTGIVRDQDSPLTTNGHGQAYRLGLMLGRDPSYRVDYIIVSPYLRAKQTAEEIMFGYDRAGSWLPKTVVEERIREIEFGIMDGIDRKRFRELFPSEADRRERDGKYYYRPPGGENRPDVRLRVHSVLDTLNRDYVGKKVLVVCHSVVVLAFRSLLERWEEKEYLQVDKEDDVKNCGLTIYSREEERRLKLHAYNIVAPEGIADEFRVPSLLEGR
jgi:2,3-bisphosphoglycerate-dependent phosphoglycerate mutase